jgi:RES domain-containing protein
MIAWRLTRKAHLNEPLAGEGARRYGGRWYHAGTPVVYSSESLSLAVLEYLVNLPINDLPADLVSIKFEFPEDLSHTIVRISDLPANWRSYPAIEELKDIGSDWVRAAKTPILSVPSVIIPGERNYVINPAHPESKRIDVVTAESFGLDSRLRVVKRATPKPRSS